HLRKAGGNVRGLPDAKGRESLVEINVGSWHDREIEYTAMERTSAPSRKKVPPSLETGPLGRQSGCLRFGRRPRGGSGFLGELRKTSGVLHGDVREHFAVQ